jgi:hypothetical protein
MFSLFRLEQMSAAQLFAELALSLDECGNIIATPVQYGGAVTHLSYHHYKQKFVANWSKINGQNYGISQTEVGDIIAQAINKMAEANPLWIFEHSKNACAGIKVPNTAVSYVY